MIGFFKWFKSSTKMKRWIFLIFAGILFLCYSISNFLIVKELDFRLVGKIAVSFIVGFVAIIVGIVHIQKRTLELLVEKTDTRDNVDVKSLIYNKKVYNQGPKIVVLGGGEGLNNILRGLKSYTDNITAIVNISDSDVNSMYTQSKIQINSLDDVKKSIMALATDEELVGGLFRSRISDDRLIDYTVGDIFLYGMNEYTKDFTKSIEKMKDVLNMTGKVLPVTFDKATVCAELEDGTIIEGKYKIPEAVNSKASKINRVYLNPYNCRVAPGVIEEIMGADAIIIAPGSLYTSIIPVLLIKGVTKAIRESKAFKIYVSNLMTEPGQTYNYTLSDHIKAINNHAGGSIIDYCIYDTGEITPEIIRRYNMNGHELVEQDIQKAKNMGVKLMQRNIAGVQGNLIRHDPELVAQSIIELVCEDLKFRDKQNDAKYMLLNDRLKSSKRHNKRVARNRDKTAKKRINGKSKFYGKYQSRIESIQESDLKLKEKERMYKLQEKERKRREAAIRKKMEESLSSSSEKVRNSTKIAKKTKNRDTSVDEDVQMKNKIEQLNDKDRKKIIDTINKLRR